MKFYNRKDELLKLKHIAALSKESAQMTFVVGRRRIGKTRLLLRAFEKTPSIYLFVTRKNEALLCEEFTTIIKDSLKIPIYGEVRNFENIFEILMQESKRKNFTIIIDEFQEFMTLNAAVYSGMQRIWDKYKEESRINLILCGSVHSMMSRIFENSKEPLFGRATQRMSIDVFDVKTLKEILSDYAPKYTQEDLLAFYTITGGVAKYVELLIQEKAFTKTQILDTICSENSLFLDEGKNVLIEEFGKEYSNYFSILSLIASGKTSRVEIESILNMETGGYLARLENEYKLIQNIRPILSKPGSRFVKYKISDKFLAFWFRFIYKYRSTVEAGNLKYLKEIILRDYNTFSGKALEDYFISLIKKEQTYNKIGTYWENKNQNEIDIVAINEVEKKVLFGEVKRQKKNIGLNKLEEKSINIKKNFKGYTFIYAGFSIDDL